MVVLIKFVLASAGLSWILTQSILFKSFRERISRIKKKYNITIEQALMELRPIKKNMVLKKISWIADELMNCSGCMGFWTAILFFPSEYPATILNYFSACCVAAISTLIIVRFSESIRK